MSSGQSDPEVNRVLRDMEAQRIIGNRAANQKVAWVFLLSCVGGLAAGTYWGSASAGVLVFVGLMLWRLDLSW